MYLTPLASIGQVSASFIKMEQNILASKLHKKIEAIAYVVFCCFIATCFLIYYLLKNRTIVHVDQLQHKLAHPTDKIDDAFEKVFSNHPQEVQPSVENTGSINEAGIPLEADFQEEGAIKTPTEVLLNPLPSPENTDSFKPAALTFDAELREKEAFTENLEERHLVSEKTDPTKPAAMPIEAILEEKKSLAKRSSKLSDFLS